MPHGRVSQFVSAPLVLLFDHVLCLKAVDFAISLFARMLLKHRTSRFRLVSVSSENNFNNFKPRPSVNRPVVCLVEKYSDVILD